MSNFKPLVRKIFKKINQMSKLSEEEQIELFCQEWEKEHLITQEDDWLEKVLSSISPNIKNLFEYDIHTKDELINRLILFLNINSSENGTEFLNQTRMLLNTLLRLITESLSQKIQEQNPQLFITNNLQNPEDIKNLIESWNAFIQNQEHIKIQKKICNIILKLINSSPFERKPEFQKAILEIEKIPQSINDNDILKILEEICEVKIQNCNTIKKSGKEIGQNTNELLIEIDKAVNNNNEHIKEILKIKEAISNNDDNLQKEKESLVNATDVLYTQITEVNTILKTKEEKIKHLYEQLNTLSLYVKNIEEQSKLDNLTDVYNRKYIDNIAEIYEQQFQGANINYSILFFDIDNFKNINDFYGHAAGDKLLTIFSKILKQNCRGTDIVGRYGGDEFMILMPSTNLEKAKEFAKRICQTIQASNFIYKNQKINITTSIGIADRNSYENKNEMIDSADKFLYKAKKAGRNRVEWE
ncbi:GGDEF domain-containing protein [Helicobacter sp. 13S00477-4]|uniref:GGDEF domain-containing protein n=1 Tax=Helicobacter sp. 13S00477-4 TaxID=1905759 RepID=UPI000BA5C7DE|nr:GGDEF domain-containing protein [Helicobacter sp. 13S00477-4]PAF51037.1 hypothetical protein BKH44_06485 [Helicobacter sp. 13S00477-4]